MSALRIAASPPARFNTPRRISMQPPAAAAVLDLGLFTQANGYSIRKKYTNAGMKACSAGVTQDSFAINEVSTSLPDSARETSLRKLSGACAISASVNHR